MSMQWLENELRRTEDPADNERADIFAAILKARGADIALPEAETGHAIPTEELAVGAIALRSTPLVLRDANNGIITEDMKQEMINHEASQAIKLKARQILEPYDHLFDQYIPSGGRLRSRLGLRPSKAEATWSFSLDRAEMELAYAYKLESSRAYGIESVILSTLSQHHNSSASNNLILGFTANQIDFVGLEWKEENAPTLMKLTAGSQLHRFLKGFMSNDGNSADCHVSFDLGVAQPGLSLGQNRHMPIGQNYKGRDSSSYKFDPVQRSFQRYVGIIDRDREALQAGALRPESLSQEEFLVLLSDTMGLIPTISQEDIQQA